MIKDMKTKIFLLIFLFISMVGVAQKKEIATAKDYVKKNTNLDKAEQMMRTLLDDSANRTNTKIWNVLFDAQRRQYENGNEKLYLKQKYDTAFGIGRLTIRSSTFHIPRSLMLKSGANPMVSC